MLPCLMLKLFQILFVLMEIADFEPSLIVYFKIKINIKVLEVLLVWLFINILILFYISLKNLILLEQMRQRVFGCFKAVALAAFNPTLVTSHIVTTAEKNYIKVLHNLTFKDDKKKKDEALEKGYETIGDTASLDHFYDLASRNLYCSTTGVLWHLINPTLQMSLLLYPSIGESVVLVLDSSLP